MTPQLIISAIIRLIGLVQFFKALEDAILVPGHLTMLASDLPASVRDNGRLLLKNDGLHIWIYLVCGGPLWIYAARISAFVLRSLEPRPGA